MPLNFDEVIILIHIIIGQVYNYTMLTAFTKLWTYV